MLSVFAVVHVYLLHSVKSMRRAKFVMMGAIRAALLFGSVVASAAVVAAAPDKVSFPRDIQPLFSTSCYECHGPEKQKGGLRVDQKAAALKGGDSGPLFVPGKSADSLLIQAVLGTKA